MNRTLEHILPRVQKPARYTGGEYNAVVKDRHQVDVRYALCFFNGGNGSSVETRIGRYLKRNCPELGNLLQIYGNSGGHIQSHFVKTGFDLLLQFRIDSDI